MTKFDWSEVEPKDKPSRKMLALYRRWVAYLKDSKLSEFEIRSRAQRFAEQGKKVPNG